MVRVHAGVDDSDRDAGPDRIGPRVRDVQRLEMPLLVPDAVTAQQGRRLGRGQRRCADKAGRDAPGQRGGGKPQPSSSTPQQRPPPYEAWPPPYEAWPPPYEAWPP